MAASQRYGTARELSQDGDDLPPFLSSISYGSRSLPSPNFLRSRCALSQLKSRGKSVSILVPRLRDILRAKRGNRGR
jgi:hypothetical protein